MNNKKINAGEPVQLNAWTPIIHESFEDKRSFRGIQGSFTPGVGDCRFFFFFFAVKGVKKSLVDKSLYLKALPGINLPYVKCK